MGVIMSWLVCAYAVVGGAGIVWSVVTLIRCERINREVRERLDGVSWE